MNQSGTRRTASQDAVKNRSPSQYTSIQNAPRTVHILGTGSIGKLVAHSIRAAPDPPPVTLLLHRPRLIDEWNKSGAGITLTTKNVPDVQTGFNVELSLPNRRGKPNAPAPDPGKVEVKYLPYISDEPIHNLIVSVKAHQTIAALSSISHRLSRDSTICLMQNGMGVEEELNEKLFPDVETRPAYMLGINSHGVHSTGSFSAIHAGFGTIFLGIVPRIPFRELPENHPARRRLHEAGSSAQTSQQDADTGGLWNASSRYLLRRITRPPVLGAVSVSPSALFQNQLEKLAVNCVINPLTVLLDSRNGDLLHNDSLSRTMRLLLAEICLVYQNLPELRGIPNIQTRFSVPRLETLAVNVAQKTGANISSMLADVRRGNETEIDYINGYIVRRGEEMGIKPVMNYIITQLVRGKQTMISREIDNFAPFEYKQGLRLDGKGGAKL